MRFKEAQELKTHIQQEMTTGAGLANVGVGIGAADGVDNVRIALRVEAMTDALQKVISKIDRLTSGEIDLRITGPIASMPDSSRSKTVRPHLLTIGASIGHYRGPGGTLGFFARRRTDDAIGFVSCNHIIAALDTALDGDDVLSPAAADGGLRPRDVIGYVDGTYPRVRSEKSPMDCAFAMLNSHIDFDPLSIESSGQLSQEIAQPGADSIVEKIGRTTDRTRGRVSAWGLSHSVHYPFGVVRFENLIEIESDGREAFSRAGDSGALVFTLERQPLALLFGVTPMGGANNLGYSLAQPIKALVDALNVTLIGHS